MYSWTQTAKLFSFFLALVATARAAVLLSPSSLYKRVLIHEEGAQVPEDDIYTFQHLRRGGFRPNPRMRRFSTEQFLSQFPEVYFYQGAPFIRVHEGQTFNKAGLQQVFANFNKFHIHNADTDQFLTYEPFPGNANRALIVPGGDNLMRAFSVATHFTKQDFGEHVASVVHGPKVATSRQRPPNWEEVRVATPTPNTHDSLQLRRMLEETRMLKFLHTQGGPPLGLRAMRDGTVEFQHFLDHPPPVFRPF